jgi:hypothetical protein
VREASGSGGCTETVVAHGVQPVSAVLVTEATGQVGGRGVLDISWPAWANFLELRQREAQNS